MSKYNKEDLERMILVEKFSYEEIGRKYEVSGNCIKKQAKKLGIELPKRRIINSSENFNANRSKYNMDDLVKYNEQGLSYSEIGKIYGVSGSSIFRIFKKFNIKKLNLVKVKYKDKDKDENKIKITKDKRDLSNYKNIINSFPKNDFINIVKNSLSIADILRKLKIPVNTSLYRYVRNRVNKLNLDISHFSGKNWNKGKKTGYLFPINDYLVENGEKKISTYHLKERLFNEKLKERKCECCGITEWNGKPAPLELHHIDGNNRNNILSNLQILCPNCHAQINNYCSKNKKNRKKGGEDE